MWEIWANLLLPKALKSCPKSNKSPNLVTLTMTKGRRHHAINLFKAVHDVSNLHILIRMKIISERPVFEGFHH